MAVIAARSWAWAARREIADMEETKIRDRRESRRTIAAPASFVCALSLRRPPPENESAPAHRRGARDFGPCCRTSAAVAEEAQQEQEQVDEVEIERERAHH